MIQSGEYRLFAKDNSANCYTHHGQILRIGVGGKWKFNYYIKEK